MAAFTEARGQSMRSINDLLNMRNQRKQANADRIVQGGQFAAGLMQQSSEAEKDREAQLERIGATGEEQRATAAAKYEPFPDGPREIVDAATGRTVLANTPAEYEALSSQLQGFRQEEDIDAQAALQESNNQARSQLQSQIDDASMSRLDAQIQAEIDSATTQFRRRSEDYDEEQSFYSPTTGKNYRWQTQEEFELVKQQIENDNYLEAQRVIAALRGTDQDTASKIREAYEFAKQELLWDAETQSFRDLSTMSEDELRSAFMDAVDFYTLAPEEAERAYRLFTTFMGQAELPPEDEGGGETPRPGGLALTTPLAQDFAEDRTGFLGRATTPGIELFARLFPGAAARLGGYELESEEPQQEARIPESNITDRERDIFRQLVELYQTAGPEDQAEIATYIDDVTARGESAMIPDILSFLDRAMGTQPKNFDFNRIGQ